MLPNKPFNEDEFFDYKDTCPPVSLLLNEHHICICDCYDGEYYAEEYETADYRTFRKKCNL